MVTKRGHFLQSSSFQNWNFSTQAPYTIFMHFSGKSIARYWQVCNCLEGWEGASSTLHLLIKGSSWEANVIFKTADFVFFLNLQIQKKLWHICLLYSIFYYFVIIIWCFPSKSLLLFLFFVLIFFYFFTFQKCS